MMMKQQIQEILEKDSGSSTRRYILVIVILLKNVAFNVLCDSKLNIFMFLVQCVQEKPFVDILSDLSK